MSHTSKVAVLVAVLAVLAASTASAQLTPFPGPLPMGGAGGAGGSGTVGPGVAGEVAFFSAATTVVSDAGFLYNSGTDAVTVLGTVFAGGGDASATPNFFVDTGEGVYDCGADCIDMVSSGGNADEGSVRLTSPSKVASISIANSSFLIDDNDALTSNFAYVLDGIQILHMDRTSTVFNNSLNDFDFNVKGDTDANLLFVDASVDRVGIGVALPLAKLHVVRNFDGGNEHRLENTSNTANAYSALTMRGPGSGDYLAIENYAPLATTYSLTPGFPAAYPLQDMGAIGSGSTKSGIVFYTIGPSPQTNSPQPIDFVIDNNLLAGNTGFNLILRIKSLEVVVNDDSLATVDFRAETDANANGIFLDASAETIDLVGGSASTGCSIDASGNMTCTGTLSSTGIVQSNGVYYSTGSALQAAACAAGVLALNPNRNIVNIDANGAACAVTLDDAAFAAGGFFGEVTISVATSAGAGAVTFPNVAGEHAGPTLCTTTGLALNGVYTIRYTDLAADMFLGTACVQN